MKRIRTHTFNGRKYTIDFVRAIEGATDTPGKPDTLEMCILDRDDFIGLHSAFHEALEASGFCDKCLHFSDGNSRTIDAARFLWRWFNFMKDKTKEDARITRHKNHR